MFSFNGFLKTILICIIFTSFAYSQDSRIGWMFINENTIPLDKQQHFTGFTFVGLVTSFITYDLGASKWERRIKTLGIGTAIGSIKEWSDPYWSWSDMLTNTIGLVFGEILAEVFTNRKERINRMRAEKIAKIDAFYN